MCGRFLFVSGPHLAWFFCLFVCFFLLNFFPELQKKKQKQKVRTNVSIDVENKNGDDAQPPTSSTTSSVYLRSASFFLFFFKKRKRKRKQRRRPLRLGPQRDAAGVPGVDPSAPGRRFVLRRADGFSSTATHGTVRLLFFSSTWLCRGTVSLRLERRGRQTTTETQEEDGRRRVGGWCPPIALMSIDRSGASGAIRTAAATRNGQR